MGYLLNVHWTQSELARWKEHKQGNQSRTSHGSEHSSTLPKTHILRNPHADLEYTKEEKAWLKVHYGNEYKFLMTYGLSIFDDEDREDGRRMVRAFMAEERPVDEDLVKEEMGGDLVWSEDERAEADDAEDYGEESDDDIEGNMADYLFDERSLCWIKKYYDTSMGFMYSYGLKFYDLDDCKLAQKIMEDVMREG